MAIGTQKIGQTSKGKTYSTFLLFYLSLQFRNKKIDPIIGFWMTKCWKILLSNGLCQVKILYHDEIYSYLFNGRERRKSKPARR